MSTFISTRDFGAFLLLFGLFVCCLGAVVLCISQWNRGPLSAVLLHPLHHRERTSRIPGEYISPSGIAAPYFYLAGGMAIPVGLLLLVLGS